MDTLLKAREMCASLQNDEAYINFKAAKEANDNDLELQTFIGEFNLIMMSMDKELSKSDRDDDKMNELNERLREVYSKIMDNQTMKKYNEAKAELDKLTDSINMLISLTVSGEDPMTCSLDSSCGGHCETCGGCH